MSKTLQYQCTSFNLITTNNYRHKNIFVFKIKLHGFRAKFTVWNHNKLYDKKSLLALVLLVIIIATTIHKKWSVETLQKEITEPSLTVKNNNSWWVRECLFLWFLILLKQTTKTWHLVKYKTLIIVHGTHYHLPFGRRLLESRCNLLFHVLRMCRVN